MRFTCDSAGGESGEGLSPALSWSGVPVEATNLAVVVTDLSADGFVHWVVAGIDPGVTGLGEGEAPAGGIQGTNGFGEVGWGGPCPPPGTGEHEYLVQLHALDQDLGLAPGFDGEEVIPDIEASSIATVSVVGRYSAAPRAAAASSSTTVRPAHQHDHGQHSHHRRQRRRPRPSADGRLTYEFSAIPSRYSANFSCAARRRVGTCSLGTSAGLYCLSTCRATVTLWTSSGPS